MKKKEIIISLLIIIVLIVNFGIRPYLIKRQALITTKKILKLWMANDIMGAKIFWKEEKDLPPFYNITSYKILNYQYYKENSDIFARISFSLTFAPNNIYPSGKEWVFILKKFIGTWKVVDFHQKETPIEDEWASD